MNKMSKEPVKKCDKISKDEIMNYMTGSNKHINILVEAAHHIQSVVERICYWMLTKWLQIDPT